MRPPTPTQRAPAHAAAPPRPRRTAFGPPAAALLLALALSAAAPAQYRLDARTTDDGLPQNSVHSILQTPDGYLWFTTSDGLVRYDGVRFRVFDKSGTPGLASNRFRVLHLGSDGTLWAGTENGGLTGYRDGQFKSYTAADGLPDNWVRGILDEPGGGGLLVFTSRGLVRFSAGRFAPYAPGAERINPFEVAPSRAGGFWYLDYAGAHRRDASGLTSYTTREGISSRTLTAILEDREGRVWVGTRDSGVNLLRDGRVTVLGAREGLPEPHVTDVYEDRDGRVWVGTASGGLARYEGGRFVTYVPPGGSPGKGVYAMFQDREGTLWLGTINNGLNRLGRDLVRVYWEREGLADNYTYPVHEDRAGTIWVGTWNKGLHRLEGDRFALYRGLEERPPAYVAAVYDDAEGRLWVGGEGHLWPDRGALVGYFRAGRFTDMTGELGLAGQGVRVIRQDRGGAFWFGTKGGLTRYGGGAVRRYTSRDGLAADEVVDVLEDRRGDLWVATTGGVSRLGGGRVESFTARDGLASNHVRTLHETEDGAVWVGTYDGGLSRIKDGRVATVRAADGLFNNGVFRILGDDRGNFWISSNRGIYRVARRQLEDFMEGRASSVISVPYGKEDGLISTECNGGRQPAGVRARDGRLWFPTQAGVAVIDPREVTHNPLAPPVLVEEVLVGREAVPAVAGVTLRPGQENVEIRYTGLSFVKPAEVKFRYRLEGLEDEWVEAGTRRAAYYSHLPPGDYTFRVVAANSDGVWNAGGASVRLTVVPPFYRTWWFVALCAAGVAAVAFVVYERRVSLLKRRQAAQAAFSRRLIESQESERKRIAAELHDSIGQSLAIIKNRAALGLRNGGDHGRLASEQLGEISEAAAHAIEEVRTVAYGLRPLQLDQLGLKLALESLLRKASGPAGLRVTYEIDDVDGLLPPGGEINLYRIVQEALGNCVKHAEATEAHVALRRRGDAVELTVRDNGRGFAAGAAGTGARPKFGLLGIDERARMLGGRASVRSAPGQGTTVSVQINLETAGDIGNGAGDGQGRD
jgi:signal transduction histidine kinase/ligand-binding sensor domain-containing protein